MTSIKAKLVGTRRRAEPHRTTHTGRSCGFSTCHR